jgi:hypothetical protein
LLPYLLIYIVEPPDVPALNLKVVGRVDELETIVVTGITLK